MGDVVSHAEQGGRMSPMAKKQGLNRGRRRRVHTYLASRVRSSATGQALWVWRRLPAGNPVGEDPALHDAEHKMPYSRGELQAKWCVRPSFPIIFHEAFDGTRVS